VKLIVQDICGRWLGLCQYADIDIGLAPVVKVLPRPNVLPFPAETDKAFGLPRRLSWWTFKFLQKIAKMLSLFSVNFNYNTYKFWQTQQDSNNCALPVSLNAADHRKSALISLK